MRIEIASCKKSDRVKFKDLKVGDVFIFDDNRNADQAPKMKTFWQDGDGGSDRIPAYVGLQSGHCYSFYNGEEVDEMNCIIKNGFLTIDK